MERLKIIVLLSVIVFTASCAVDCSGATAGIDLNRCGSIVMSFADRGLWQSDGRGVKQRRLVQGLDVEDFVVDRKANRIIVLAGPPMGDRFYPPRDLYLLSANTGRLHRVTRNLYGTQLFSRNPGNHNLILVARTRQYEDPGIPDSDGGLWMVNLKNGHPTRLIGPANADVTMTEKTAFSPNGNRLAVLRRGRTVAVFKVSNPDRWWRLPFLSDAISDLAWLDSHRLVVGVNQAWRSYGSRVGPTTYAPGGVWIWDLRKSRAFIRGVRSDALVEPYPSSQARGEAVTLIGSRRQDTYGLCISRTGRHLAYLTNKGLFVADTRNWRVRKIMDARRVPHMSEAKRGREIYPMSFRRNERFLEIRYREGGYLADTNRRLVVDTRLRRIAGRINCPQISSTDMTSQST